MTDDEDRDETRVRAVADGIRQMIGGPNSADDVDHAVEAAMGDEDADEAMHGPNVRRVSFFNLLGRGKIFIGKQADGSWVARTEGALLPQTQQLVPGSTPEEAAGAMIAQLEEAGHDVPEPPADFMEDRGLGH